MNVPSDTPLLHTPLHAWHVARGARMVPFAGYSMPVQYAGGLMAEHHQCRRSAALFDVSHMGQIALHGGNAAAALESLVPVDVQGLGLLRQRYAFFTLGSGGLLDDLMITRREDHLFLVVNAGGKDADTAHLQQHIGTRCGIEPLPDRALLALQGPAAATVLTRLNPQVQRLVFMTGGDFELAGAECFVTRSGYTGEDGFEISVPAERAVALADALCSHAEVQPAGLGARDTLRLEAGMCLYGQDIDQGTTPIEAGLAWAIQKVRRPGGERAGGYPGAALIEQQLGAGPPRRRVGLLGVERVPVRAGAELFSPAGAAIGRVSSGTLAPSVNQAIAMGYVGTAHAALGTEVHADVRGKRVPMHVCTLPFQPHRYVRG